MKTVLLTGATGFIGEHIYDELKNKYKIIIFVRKQSLVKLGEKYKRNNVFIAEGDIEKPNSLLKINISPDYIIHAAALYNTSSPKKELEKVNIKGTRNLLSYAKGIKKLKCFCYISTIYVSGNCQTKFPENTLPKVGDFHNHYEETKYIGEQLVRKSQLPHIIYRPPIVVGHSTTGKINTLNGLYKTLNIIKSGKLLFYPGDCHGKLFVAPVDVVASFIAKTFSNKQFIGKCFNMVEENPITYKQFIDHTIKYLSIGKPFFTFPSWIWKLSVKLMGVKSLEIFNQDIKYENVNYLNAMQKLNSSHPSLKVYFKPIMDYYKNVK